MRITPNAIFTRVKTAVLEQFPTANCTQTYSPTPTKFPTVFARQLPPFTPRGGVSLNYSQDVEDVTWEVQVFSNKQSGAKEQAEKLLSIVKLAFRQMYFTLYTANPIDTSNDYYTLAARFRRTVCDGDKMP